MYQLTMAEANLFGPCIVARPSPSTIEGNHVDRFTTWPSPTSREMGSFHATETWTANSGAQDVEVGLLPNFSTYGLK